MSSAPGLISCKGYRATLTPWRCIENQLSPMLLPGFPCWDCTEAIGLALPDSKPKARQSRKKLPAWLENASAAVRRDYLRDKETK